MATTFTEAWDEIEETLADAKAIAFDTCHKIYVLMDDDQVALMRGYGYDPLITSDEATPDEMLITLQEWYDQSCALRFISAVETVPEGDNPNERFTDLIPQGFGEGEECNECDDTTTEGEWVDGLWYCLGCQPDEEEDDDDEDEE